MKAGRVASLRDIGKPNYIARLLVGRRDNDPQGVMPPRSELRDVVRVDDNEIIFDVLTLTSTATSLTSATPGARRTLARSIYVPAASSIYTAWVTSTAVGAACQEQSCPPCNDLRCECPPPKCNLPDASADPLDLAIVSSLRVQP